MFVTEDYTLKQKAAKIASFYREGPELITNLSAI